MSEADKTRLEGVTIVWTGSKDAATSLLGALEDVGATVERLPLIEFGPPEDELEVEQMFSNIDRFSWILFTSARAADGVAGLPSPAARVAAVGPATRRRLLEQGWRVDLTPEQNDANGLADALSEELPVERPVLFVRGDRARRALPDRLIAMGVSVEEVVVYATRPVGQRRAEDAVRRIVDSADAVIMGSPSGVETLIGATKPGALGELKPGLKWFCLGGATREALKTAGIQEVAFPKKTTPKQLVEIFFRAF
ncbi:MAG: uroporphyrinogen-III synthase [Deltaproteobacteria bacterium]|nr:uroporphyrinogen-III synthase [Deltaproteobacteria bacterium]